MAGSGKRAVVIGGGLAGMVASLELVKRGYQIDLFESSSRLGGKAGSDADPQLYDKHGNPDDRHLPEGVESDHGYHVFPKWYTNMRALWQDIGVTPDQVYEGEFYLDLARAVEGARQPFRVEKSASLTQIYSICDLVLQSDENVKDLTLQAFLQSRDYYNPSRPLSLNDFILNALTIGDADISSYAVRNVFDQWLPVFTDRNWDALRGSLDEILIQPLLSAIERWAAADGDGAFEVHYNHKLVGLEICNDGSTRAVIEGPSGTDVYGDHPLVVCIPQEVLRDLATSELYEHVPEIASLHHLRSNPFSAIDIHFDGDLGGFPEEHFTLTDSGYGITGFDISKHWPRLKAAGRTVLQFVAAKSVDFRGLDGPGFVRKMYHEIGQFLPEIPERVDFAVPHINMDVPLFVNDVGTWKFRPQTTTRSSNLFFASDYVRNDTDVTSMEGAIRTGLMGAEAVRAAFAPSDPPVRILPPVSMPEEFAQIRALAEVDPTEARLMALGWLFGRLKAAGKA